MLNKLKQRIVIGVVLIALFLPVIGVKATLPVAVTADVTATAIATKGWLETAWTYMRDKIATIFFQNILRKVLNEFATDAAKYVAAGGNGQEALYIKDKWGDFWANIGDKATGEFVESFANSVISDIAANDAKSKGGLKLCQNQRAECYAKVDTTVEPLRTTDMGEWNKQLRLGRESCEQAYSDCLATQGAGGNESASYQLCQDNKTVCDTACNGDTTCLKSCDDTYISCSASTGGTIGAQRKAPMFKAANSPLARVNICNPRLEVALSISLGLTQQANTNWTVNCKFSEMVKNWGNEINRIKDISSKDFLSRLSTMFVPGGNDLSVAMTMQSNLLEYKGKQVSDTEKITVAKQGWLEKVNIAGQLLGTPGQAQDLKKLSDQALIDNIGKVTGDILVDASNIFLNQLAMSLWQNLTQNLSNTNQGTLSYYTGQQVNRAALQNQLNKLSEPVFSEGGKLDVLSRLSTCPDPAKPGPTECVIPSTFSDAVSGKMSVIEAVKSGRLQGDWPFGFDKNGEDKIPYNQGYPYRSLIILRKYRILPVGWELAAQEIQRKYLANSFSDRPNGVTLNDLLACYDACDDIKGYGDGTLSNNSCSIPNPDPQAWCRGLVDPNWTLKVPEYYCARQGFGPQLMKEPDLVTTGTKYCSADNGATMTPVEGKQNPCSTPDDCCTVDELTRMEKLKTEGRIKELKAFACGATCSYEEQKLLVYRDDRYCADEQGCIKEGRNGSCLFYGYCTEERRKWIFNKDNKDEACDPMFNTCQSFRAPDGKRVAYLANTLDYGCDQSSIGCKAYSTGGAYDGKTDKVAWDKNQNIYFNKKIGACAANQEGCHEFIRIKNSKGLNLLPDGGLEANDAQRWSAFGSAVSKAVDANNKVYAGGYSLHVPLGAKGVYFGPDNKSLLPTGFEFEVNRFYSLSAYVYIVSGKVELSMGNQANPANNEGVLAETTGSWQQVVLNFFDDPDIKADFFAIRAVGAADFYVDNIKFEIGDPSAYSAYGNNLVYEKLLPAYMEKACYNNPPSDYNYKENAPAKCQNFARKCQKEEVGCELYTQVNTKDQTAAQVKPTDYCPEECVGYDTFIQRANNFYSAKDEYFIPKTAKTCSAQAVGCSLFVNLDKVKTGGEENEYFANFRRCIKPDNSCAEFYTWEGSDQSGYQLVVYQLKENKAANISQPETVDDNDPTDTKDGDVCNDLVYALPHDSPNYNPDCRQFYGRDGNVSYHLISKTITCSQQCFPYRLVQNNVDVSITNEADCRTAAFVNGAWKYGFWDNDKQECIRCLNGGEWQDEHKACVFMADPTKSQSCNASESGCSEYEGDFSNNVRVIFNDTFENNSLSGWGPTTQISSEAMTVGGHSLQIGAVNNNVKAWFEKSVKGQLKIGKRYVLSFAAKKKDASAQITGVSFRKQNGNGLDSLDFAGKIDLTADWKQFKFDLKITDQNQLDYAEVINLNTNGQSEAIRLDNIKLLEMSDTYFLIKDSWKTPDSCNQDQQGNPAPLYMLGCEQYKDRDGLTQNLKSFDKLCQESAVGCELMIDTFNSSFYGQQIFGNVTIPADKFAYIVYEKKKECRSSDKGCSRLGLDRAIDDTYTDFKDVYLGNNPDRYGDTLCTKDQVGCEAWGNEDGGEVYFKEPGLRTCEFKNGGWFKADSNHCVSANTCTLDIGCASNQSCVNGFCTAKASCDLTSDCNQGEECKTIKDNTPCETSYDKTIGLGVREDKAQPIGMAEKDSAGKIGNAGTCPVNQNGCTEYIDPESRASYNLMARGGNSIELKTDTLYIFSGLINSCGGKKLFHIDGDNKLISSTSLGTIAGFSDEFYIDGAGGDKTVGCDVRAGEIKEALVNYRLQDSLNKEKPTDVDFALGQVLFNARTFSGGKYNTLIYSTNQSQSGQPKSSKPTADDNANVLLKVDPDRECAKWLGCKSYIDNPSKPGDKICYQRGLCDRMNEAGECISFINNVGLNTNGQPVSQIFNEDVTKTKVSDISSLSGFSKVGYEGNLLNADMYHLANMIQDGETKVKFNGSFENTWNSGFTVVGQPNNAAAVVSDAKILEKELGFGSYKLIPDGRAVAKANQCVVKTIDNVGGRYYIASAYVYLRYGTKVDLTIGDPDNSLCPLESVNDDNTKKCLPNARYGVIASTDTTGRWVRLTSKFSIPNSYQANGERKTKITIGICSPAGMVYFDDVRIEPGLKEKDKTYIHSDCRLYPERDAMSCNYSDASGLRKKGWSGYCLEYDPRNPGACLLWYPIDKVDSEEYEQGAGLNIAKDTYYCIDGEDQCNVTNKTEPEFYCKKFIKVNKDSYWYDRLAGQSNYRVPFELIDPSYRTWKQSHPTEPDQNFFYADFGVNAGGSTKDIAGDKDPAKDNPIILSQAAGSGFYGAYSPGFDLENYDQKATLGIYGKKLIPFVSYYGVSQAGAGGKDRKYFCEATLDSDGNVQPIEVSDCAGCNKGGKEKRLGVYDDCYVGIGAIWKSGTQDDCSDGGCKTWSYGSRSCSNGHCAWEDFIGARNQYIKQADIVRDFGKCTLDWSDLLDPYCLVYKGLKLLKSPSLDSEKLFDYTKCEVKEGADKVFTGKTTDTCGSLCNPFDWGDGNEAGCLFECFNHTKWYHVAKDGTSDKGDKLYYAKQAVKRLFTNMDQCLVWDGSKYTTQGCGDTISQPTHCSNDVRPDFSASSPDADYCYVNPAVKTVLLDEGLKKGGGSYYALNKRGWVAIRFTSQIDKEQQPLKKYKVNWNYFDAGGYNVNTVHTVDALPQPKITNPHIVYYFLDIDDMRNSHNTPIACPAELKATTCYSLTPSVVITDNWGKQATGYLGYTENPSNVITKPLIIYE